MNRRRIATLVPLAAGALAASGCALFEEPKAIVGAGEPYPQAVEPGPVWDIQVFRDVTRLKMTNSTAIGFGPGRVWVNRRFSHPFDGLAPGQSLDLPLHRFTGEFGEPFRAGGFFATEIPEEVVMVELEATSGTDRQPRRHGLIVVENVME